MWMEPLNKGHSVIMKIVLYTEVTFYSGVISVCLFF